MASQRHRLHNALMAASLPGAALGLLTALPLTPAQAQNVGADLKVVSPRSGATLGDKAFSLDVSFHSRSSVPVISTELWVDGVRWVHRDLDTPQVKNVLSFAVDSSSLSQGSHTFLVRVYTANGGVGEARLEALAGSEGTQTATGSNAPAMKFNTPVNGRRVMGQVDLLLDSPTVNGMNPYVTIYVDKQFKTLKNFPPYNYTWDTTAVANGLHTIEATSYLESSQQSTSRSIKVLVDNPGGNTALKTDIPDLSIGGKNAVSTAKSIAIGLPAKKATLGSPTIAEDLRPSQALKAASVGLDKNLQATMPAVAPVAEGMPTLTAPSASAMLAAHKSGAAHHVVAPLSMHTASKRTPLISLVSARPDAASAMTLTVDAHTSTVSHHAQTMMAMHADMARLASETQIDQMDAAPTISPATPILPSPMIAAHAVLGAPHYHARMHHAASHSGLRAVLRHGHHGILQGADYRPLQVAFNGQQIAFDVQPRVEAGLPIAPFRQIFEHTGGQVDWVEKTQVVHAVNASKEITIKVGKSTATVNGQNVSMERPAFTERGRTIVPLSFVGSALDVNIDYDAMSGKLQITSK